jgi:hypothetical protein
MKIFILEDILDRIEFFKSIFKGHELIFSDNYSDAIKILEDNKDINKLYLDHDINNMIHLDSPNTEWNGFEEQSG